jgi:hypothetical protein
MHCTINEGGFEQVEEALYKLEPCTDHLALFVRPRGRCISKKQPSHFSVATPQSPLALPHPLSCICVRVSVVLNSRPCALLPPPLFSLSSLSLPSLLLACHVHVHIRICGPLISSPPSLSPHVSCLHSHSWWCALLPPLPCSLAHIHDHLSLPCTVFVFTAGPPPESPLCLVRIHDPSRDCIHVHNRPPPIHVHDRARVRVLHWPATPSPLPVPRATCQVCDWHSSWHALTDGLALILALALCWPSTPTPMLGVHDTLCSRSLVFVFGVLCVCVHSPSCSHLWPCVCGFIFMFMFVALCLCSHL